MPYADGKMLLNRLVPQVIFNDCKFLIPYWGGYADHRSTIFHKHSFWEMCFIVNGAGSYHEKNQSFPLRAGTLFLSKPNIRHKIESETGLNILYVAFEEDQTHFSRVWRKYLQQLFAASTVLYLAEEDPVSFLWKALYTQALESDAQFLDEILQNLAKSLLSLSFAKFAPAKKDRSLSELNENENQKLTSTIKKYIIDNLSLELRSEDVAEQFYISTRQLSRFFLRYEGISFAAYKKQQRLKQATNDIKNTDLSFSVIAEKNGFATLQYFSKSFTEYMRETPSAFRKMYLQEQKNQTFDPLSKHKESELE